MSLYIVNSGLDIRNCDAVEHVAKILGVPIRCCFFDSDITLHDVHKIRALGSAVIFTQSCTLTLDGFINKPLSGVVSFIDGV